MVRTAIKQGILVRPEICEDCGKKPPLDRDGVQRIHAHHHLGYDRPLDVKWLCAKCHRAVTPFPENPGAPVYGEGNGQSKLTEDDVREIRQLWSKGSISKTKLGQQFGVTRTTILLIVTKRAWPHVS